MAALPPPSFIAMEINTIEICGLHSALMAVHLPYSGEPKSSTKFKLYMDGHYIKHSSCVNMSDGDIKLLSTLVKRGDEHAKVLRGINVYSNITAPIYFWCEMETYGVGRTRLSSQSTMHTDCRGLGGEELQKAKADIPMGKELTKIDCFNYQCLRHIYFQRKNHRLPEWHKFCEWIESLPFSDELITITQ